MEIVKISPNDTLSSIARKCNQNFRQIAWSSRQAVKSQSRIDSDNVTARIAEIYDEIGRVIGSISSEVSAEVARQDIPRMVSDEVTRQVVLPPVGSYLLTNTDPALTYANTTWQQTDSVTTDTSVVIPLWERTA